MIKNHRIASTGKVICSTQAVKAWLKAFKTFTIFVNMVVRFENKQVLELYQLEVKACVAKFKFAKHIVEKYKLRIGQLIDAPDLKTMGQIKSLNLEKLKGDRKGQFSIRVDNQFRICFRELNENEITVEIIEITDYH